MTFIIVMGTIDYMEEVLTIQLTIGTQTNITVNRKKESRHINSFYVMFGWVFYVVLPLNHDSLQ